MANTRILHIFQGDKPAFWGPLETRLAVFNRPFPVTLTQPGRVADRGCTGIAAARGNPSHIGKSGLNIRQTDSPEPQELSVIALKNMRNLRVCHASMLLAF